MAAGLPETAPCIQRRLSRGPFLLPLLIAAGFNAYAAIRLQNHGLVSTAKVVDLDTQGKNQGAYWEFVIIDGRTVVVRESVTLWESFPDLGSQEPVVYDPQDPELNHALGGRPSFSGLACLLIPALLIGFFGWRNIIRRWGYWHDNAEAWRHGRHTA